MVKNGETRRGPKPFSLGRSTRRPVAFGSVMRCLPSASRPSSRGRCVFWFDALVGRQRSAASCVVPFRLPLPPNRVDDRQDLGPCLGRQVRPSVYDRLQIGVNCTRNLPECAAFCATRFGRIDGSGCRDKGFGVFLQVPPRPPYYQRTYGDLVVSPFGFLEGQHSNNINNLCANLFPPFSTRRARINFRHVNAGLKVQRWPV